MNLNFVGVHLLNLRMYAGFMMESTLWGGSDARTIQFVVPTVRTHILYTAYTYTEHLAVTLI